MWWFQMVQLMHHSYYFFFFGGWILCIIWVLQLMGMLIKTVNYIEHYGLV